MYLWKYSNILDIDSFKDLSYKELKKVKEENIEEIFWRKCNMIHKWFVDNVQNGIDDCEIYRVSSEQYDDLLNTIKQSLKHKEVLLPPQEGFFFGSTEIDEWYWKSLERTKKLMESWKVDWDNEIVVYQSSW